MAFDVLEETALLFLSSFCLSFSVRCVVGLTFLLRLRFGFTGAILGFPFEESYMR